MKMSDGFSNLVYIINSSNPYMVSLCIRNVCLNIGMQNSNDGKFMGTKTIKFGGYMNKNFIELLVFIPEEAIAEAAIRGIHI